MARIFITGSADGLGLMSGRLLAEQGHTVVLHARSADRAAHACRALPAADAVVVGDVSTLVAMRDVAAQANDRGRFDAVIHNVALGYQEPRRLETVDGLSRLWAVNVLAPYVLTALMHRPDRLIYLSSGMHTGGDASLEDLQWAARRWNGSQAYADTKLHDVLLAFGVARRWPGVRSNAVTPGWVPTKMGGPAAPRSGAGHASLAGHERRTGRAGHRRLLLPSAARAAACRRAAGNGAGPAARRLSRRVRHRAGVTPSRPPRLTREHCPHTICSCQTSTRARWIAS